MRIKTRRNALEVRVLGHLARYLGRPFIERAQRARRDQLQRLTPRSGAVVMLGDSITEYGEWTELLPGFHVVNRGVGGETTAEVLERVEPAMNAPSVVCLLIGTNDLSVGASSTYIANNVDRIRARISGTAPDARILLQGVMPRHPKYSHEIRETNRRIKSIASARGVEYLDLWSALSDGADGLNPAFTHDNLHLNGAGYLAWSAALRPVLERLVSGTLTDGGADQCRSGTE